MRTAESIILLSLLSAATLPESVAAPPWVEALRQIPDPAPSVDAATRGRRCSP